MIHIARTLLFLLILLIPMFCKAADASATVRRIGISDGLSGDRIFSLTQDCDGFIWAVSYWGVDRFDGRIVKTYHPTHNGEIIKHFLYHTKIHSYQDKVILGEQNGLIFEYNPKLDDFEEIADVRKLTGENDLILKDFCLIGNGIYFATNYGLYCFNCGNLQMVSQRADISAIGHDGKNHIYYVADRKLIYLNGDRTLIIAELGDVARFIHSARSKMYIGTNDSGLFIYDLSTQKLTQSNARFHKCHLTAVANGNEGELLIGTDGAGCYVYDMTNDRIIESYSESMGSMPVGNAVMDVLLDRDSNIWVATFNGALSMIHHDNSRFSALMANNRIPGFGNSFLQSKNGVLWIASDNGVLMYNPELSEWKHYLKDRPEKSIIVSLAEDSGGNIWAAGFGSGIYRISNEGTISHFTTKLPLCGRVLDSDYVAVVIIDGDNLWAGSYSDGKLMRFNLKDKSSDVYDVPDVHSLTVMDSYTVICGQSVQFTVLNPLTKDTIVIKNNVSITDIKSISDKVWLATAGNGLMTYDPVCHKSSVISLFNDNDEFKYIMALCHSPVDSCVYFTTYKQLYKYSYINDTVIGIGELMGLPPATYNERAIELMQSGNLLLGASNGVTDVDINMELLACSKPHIYFTEFKVAYNVISPDDNSSILSGSLNTTDIIRLSHNHNSFSIAFSMVDYGASRLTKLQYMLKGFDKEWIDATDYDANYTNVPSGRYIFKLRLCDKNTGAVISERCLEISIAKPIWATWWMIIIYTVLFGFIVFLGVKLLKGKLRQRYSDEKMKLFTEMAHELRTPVALIKAPLMELADNKDLTDEDKATLGIAIRNTDRLHELTTQLMDFQKLDAKAMILNLSTVNLLDFFAQRISPWEYRAKRKGLVFCTDINSLRNVFTSIDCPKMDAIISNILSNAVKYTSSGTIEVDAKIDDGYYSITIKDTGIGIPANEQRQLFKQFFRAKNARMSNESGSGIGLMLTHRLIELHGGSISISSKENAGTLVKLKFPIVNGDVDCCENMDCISPALNDQTILVVDDNSDMREILRKTLESNYNVIVAKDGNEAMVMAVNEMPDIIVSDLMMPGLTGEELCRKLKNDMATSHIPFILLTAVSDRETKANAFDCGADDYMTKPFDNKELKARIRIHLRHSNKLKESLQSPDGSTEDADFINPLDKEFMDKLTAIINLNIENSDYSVMSLSSDMAMSRSSLYNKLKAIAGQSPNDFIRLQRLKRAADLLKQRRYTIMEIAIMTGFSDTKYFATIFKKQFGVTPSSYAKGK